MRISVGIDIDGTAGASFLSNFPDATFLMRDICSLEESDIRPILPRRPWLFNGCAPCQPFSKQNSARSDRDKRRPLLDHFGRFVEAFHPEYVFVENVPGIQRITGNGPLTRFMRLLRRNKYHADVAVLRALWFGVPQVRERLVVLASRIGEIELPHGGHREEGQPRSTVRDWIAGLPPLEAGKSDAKDPIHRACALSDLNRMRIRATPEGGGRENWPSELVLRCHRGHAGHSDVYGRLAWDKPAAGLTTRCISLSNGRFGHPEQDRALSAREAACLQTFPRNYKFVGSLTSVAQQIGNAVPPLMARRIGEHIVSHYQQSIHSPVPRA